jgi:hypothetical protein
MLWLGTLIMKKILRKIERTIKKIESNITTMKNLNSLCLISVKFINGKKKVNMKTCNYSCRRRDDWEYCNSLEIIDSMNDSNGMQVKAIQSNWSVFKKHLI